MARNYLLSLITVYQIGFSLIVSWFFSFKNKTFDFVERNIVIFFNYLVIVKKHLLLEGNLQLFFNIK